MIPMSRQWFSRGRETSLRQINALAKVGKSLRRGLLHWAGGMDNDGTVPP